MFCQSFRSFSDDLRSNKVDAKRATFRSEDQWKVCLLERIPYDAVSVDVRKVLEKASDSDNSIVYSVTSCPNGRPEGLAAYHSIDEQFGVTSISCCAFGDPVEVSSSAAEAVYLLLKHVFELGYRRVECVCSATDDRLRDSAMRLGFTFEGMRRQNFVAKDGRNGDDYYFGILDRDWPALSKAYERWLSDENTFGNGPRRELKKFSDEERGHRLSPEFPSTNVDLVPNWAPAKIPDSKTLIGRFVRLEKLDTTKHGIDLFLALNGPEADPNLWQYVLPGPFNDLQRFNEYLEGQLSTGKLPLYAVVDENSNVAEGIIGLGYFVPEHGRITIRHVVYGGGMRRSAKGKLFDVCRTLKTAGLLRMAHLRLRLQWRNPTFFAKEAKKNGSRYLVLKEAFSLGYRRVEWECGNNNEPSKNASLRLGFTLESLHPQKYAYKGQCIDAAMYSILDKEWPPIKRALEEWLAPENHATNGQKVALSVVMSRYRSQTEAGNRDGSGAAWS